MNFHGSLESLDYDFHWYIRQVGEAWPVTDLRAFDAPTDAGMKKADFPGRLQDMVRRSYSLAAYTIKTYQCQNCTWSLVFEDLFSSIQGSCTEDIC